MTEGPMISIDAKEVLEKRLASSMGLDKYSRIMRDFNKVNVSSDKDFQREFNGFYDLSDRTPLKMMLTIPSGYNTRLLKEKDKYRFFYIREKLHPIGRITMETPFGHQVKVYDKERTICDCLRKKDQLDANLVNEAVKRYLKTPGTDFAKLLKYAEMFRIYIKI